MNSALNIFPIGYHDFEKTGYFSEIKTGCLLAKDGNLLPFFYAYDLTGTVKAVSDFVLQRINEKAEVLENHILNVAFITTEDNGFNKIMVYNGGQDILGSLTEYIPGFYRYYINTDDGRQKEFYSEVFEINACKFVSVIEAGAFDSGFDSGFEI